MMLARVLVATTTPAPRAAHSLVSKGGALRAEHMGRLFINAENHYHGRAAQRVEGPMGGVSLALCHQGEYLALSEREGLRRTIQRTVAPMTAEKLAARYEMGLEHDRRYDTALADFCALVVKPGTRVASLRDFLRTELPANQPEIVIVLFIEAVARMLGQKWIGDDCDFVDVTIGTARLQEVIRLLSFEFQSLKPRAWTPFVVLTTPVGEQHTLALHILGLLFDAMGWSSQILEGDVVQGTTVQSAFKRADVVCIGWSNQRRKKEFADIVAAVRSAAPGSRTPIVAGGVAALDSIDFLVGLGIDCICDSVYSASRICEKFYELEALGHQAQASGQRVVATAGRPDWQLR